MLRSLMVLVLVTAGCAGLDGTMRHAHDGGFTASTWREYKSKPTAREAAADSKDVTARWYLEEILALAGNAKYGATSNHVALVTNGVAQRTTSTYAFRSKEQSWVRLRLAYLHALDRDWVECAQKLMSETPGASDDNWPNWRPGTALPRDLSLGQLLGKDDNDPESILGALRDTGHSPTERERLVAVMSRVPNPPFPHHGAETAWTHAYLARLYAQSPVKSEAAWKRAVDCAIAELDQG
jgi:hypothetical protein